MKGGPDRQARFGLVAPLDRGRENQEGRGEGAVRCGAGSQQAVHADGRLGAGLRWAWGNPAGVHLFLKGREGHRHELFEEY